MIYNGGRTYIPSLEDIGAYLALYWLPTRADGKCGKPLVAMSNTPVAPGTSLLLCIGSGFLILLANLRTYHLYVFPVLI